MKMLIAILMLVTGFKTFAQEFPLTGGSFKIAPGQAQSLQLGAKKYLQTIFIQAQCYGHGEARMDVNANGRTKGSFTIPCHDPNFTVTIAEKVSSLQFVNYSNKVIEVFEVRADGKNTASGVDIPFGESAYTQSSASTLAERAIDAINLLKPSANYSQLGEYLLPIRKSGARLRVAVAANSTYSTAVRIALRDLQSNIARATKYLNQNLETDTNFDLATELMIIQEQIKTMLR